MNAPVFSIVIATIGLSTLLIGLSGGVDSSVAAALLHKPKYPSLRKAEALRIRLADGPAKAGSLRWRIDGGTGRRERLR